MLIIQAKKYFVILTNLFFIFLNSSSLIHAQQQDIQDYLIVIPDTPGVLADWDEEHMHVDVTDLEITISGYYKIIPKILYNSGDEQKNETFYMTILTPDGIVGTPVDSNAGPYKIVVDDPGPRHTTGAMLVCFTFRLE